MKMYDFFRDQGSIIAGLIALIAGIVAYAGALRAARIQVQAEQRNRQHDVETARRSIALELRQMIARAFGAYISLNRLLTHYKPPITARMIESSTILPTPIVYPSVSERIAVLNDEAMDIIIVYQLIEIGRIGANQLIHHRTPDNIPSMNIAMVAHTFLEACKYARGVFPRLRTGMALHDDKDADLVKRITEAPSPAPPPADFP